MTDKHEANEVASGLSDDTTGLGRFGWHPDPAIDFCIEVETLQSRMHGAEHGLSKPGEKPETIADVAVDIERAMWFRVGGDLGAIDAKHLLRRLEARANAAASPTAAAKAERPEGPRIIHLPYPMHGYGVCVGGRWDGWLFWHHPDGQWVSKQKLYAAPLPAPGDAP
jgi:hypothetical protein